MPCLNPWRCRASARSLVLAASITVASALTAVTIGAPVPEPVSPNAPVPTPEAPLLPPPVPGPPSEPATPDAPAAPGSPMNPAPPGEPATPATPEADPAQPATDVLDMSRFHPAELLRKEAAAMLPGRSCLGARLFVLSTAWVNVVDPRTLYVLPDRSRILSPAQHAALPPEEAKTFEAVTIQPQFYYTTRYGSPLAYARPIDILCDAMTPAFLAGAAKDPTTGQAIASPAAVFSGTRILDFGCGGMVHLQMLASMGADTVGVDIDPLLSALYSEPGDTGTFAPVPVPTANLSRDGSANLVIGSWPGDDAVRTKVGGGFDVIMSKNTLKNGYINPAREVDERLLVKLGVTNDQFVKAAFDALKPGGYFLIYNLSPKLSAPDEEYKPWSDGRSPFTHAQFEAAGFEVLAFDTVDDDAARAMGRALEWNQGAQPMDLENDLFALYTLVRKPVAKAPEPAKKPEPAEKSEPAKPAAQPAAKPAAPARAPR